MSMPTAPVAPPERHLTADGLPQLRLHIPTDEPESDSEKWFDGAQFPVPANFRVTIPITVENPSGGTARLDFLLDTGATHTVLGATTAATLGWDKGASQRVVNIMTETGSGVASPSGPLLFRIDGLEEYKFEVECLVVPDRDRGLALLGLRDLVEHFDVSLSLTSVTLTPRTKVEPESVVARARRILSSGARSGDYLVVPAEVTAQVDREIAGISKSSGVTIPLETRQWMIDNCALHLAHSGREIACWRTGKGVVVFAVGADEVRTFLQQIPGDQRPDVAIEYP